MIGVFELFKIGIGPSSSHTVGPMAAAGLFREHVGRKVLGARRITAELFGSLAWTGRGHGSDVAICLGLLGHSPTTIEPSEIPGYLEELRRTRILNGVAGSADLGFDPDADLVFDFSTVLPFHTNAMRFRALFANGSIAGEKVYYSVGGGFVVEDGGVSNSGEPPCTRDFVSAADLLSACDRTGLSIADLQRENELVRFDPIAVRAGLDAILDAMFACIDRGMALEGVLPGGLKVRRRAKALHEHLLADRLRNDRPPHEIVDWVSLFAIAVNEENAGGGRVVTAPTNGAAGIIPAVLRYRRDFCSGWSRETGHVFLLTAAAIGSLIKRRASISGAEVGCQGEVGSAAAMAAAGLAATLGGTPRQVENAAEIAMEHHLGMTCDPIGGLVQIPCIERNAFGANKAIVAASLALRGDGNHRVSFDEVIETMRQTGADMQTKYKETSQGGLAVNVAEC